MQVRCFVIWLFLLLFKYGNGSSFFDLDEVEGFHYSVNFLSDPLNEEMIQDPPTDSITFPMRNNMGQAFRCLLPSPQVIASEKTEKPPTLDLSPDLVKDVMTLLEPLKDHPCLKRAEGYWVYELCYGQYIKQYHTENNKPVGDIIFLGNYDFDYSEKEQYKNKLLRHFSQYYINGSVCEDLGTPRKAEVRYVCDPATPSEIMTNVEEPALCEYVLTVKTSRTCSLPQMRPTPKAKKKSIDCFPLLSSTQFSEYMERKNKKEDTLESVVGSSKIMSALTDDKLSDKLVDEIVALVQKSVTSKTNPENPLFTVINAQKYMDEFIETLSSPPSTADSKSSSQDGEAPIPPGEEDDVEDLINESSDLMKKISEKYSPEEVSKIINKIEGSAKLSVEDIIKEAAEDLKLHLKPLEKSEAAQVLTNSVDSLMGRIKTAIKDVDKGIQDIEEIIKEDKELLGDLEESLENEDKEVGEETNAEDPVTSAQVHPSSKKQPAPIQSEATKNKEYVGHKEDNGVIDVEEELNYGGVLPGKHDGKLSVKKDLSQQEGEYEGPDEGEEGSTEENIDELEKQRTFDEILSSVQSKINQKMGKVQVKVVSASGIGLADTDDLPSFEDEEDVRYYTQMMYESMVGNSKAYEDIKKLRRDRKGYLFSISDKLDNESEESSSSSSSISNDESKEENESENTAIYDVPDQKMDNSMPQKTSQLGDTQKVKHKQQPNFKSSGNKNIVTDPDSLKSEETKNHQGSSKDESIQNNEPFLNKDSNNYRPKDDL